MAAPAREATPEAWQRVADRLQRRRLDLGIKQDALGVSKAVASSMENARQTSFTFDTLRKVSLAVGWRADGLERILDGEEPVEAETRLGLDPEVGAEAEASDLRRRLDDALRRLDAHERRIAALERAAGVPADDLEERLISTQIAANRAQERAAERDRLSRSASAQPPRTA